MYRFITAGTKDLLVFFSFPGPPISKADGTLSGLVLEIQPFLVLKLFWSMQTLFLSLSMSQEWQLLMPKQKEILILLNLH